MKTENIHKVTGVARRGKTEGGEFLERRNAAQTPVDLFPREGRDNWRQARSGRDDEDAKEIGAQ